MQGTNITTGEKMKKQNENDDELMKAFCLVGNLFILAIILYGGFHLTLLIIALVQLSKEIF